MYSNSCFCTSFEESNCGRYMEAIPVRHGSPQQFSSAASEAHVWFWCGIEDMSVE